MSTTIHGWLKAIPEPSAIRVDGEHIIKLSKSPRRFTTAEDTIRGIGWTQLEALDAKGSILRLMKHPTDSAETASTSVQASPMVNDLQVIAGMLKAAYIDGSQATAESYRTSFDFMAKLVDAQSKFLIMQTRVLQQQLQREADAIADREDAAAEAAAGADGGVLGTLTKLADIGSLVKPGVVAKPPVAK